MGFFLGGIFVSAVIGGLIGHGVKDRAGDGLLLGLLFGPLGWLFVFALSDRQLPCPHCRGRVAKQATICRYCRPELPAQDPEFKMSLKAQSLIVLGLVGIIITMLAMVAVSANPKASLDISTTGFIGFVPSMVALIAGGVVVNTDYRSHRFRVENGLLPDD